MKSYQENDERGAERKHKRRVEKRGKGEARRGRGKESRVE